MNPTTRHIMYQQVQEMLSSDANEPSNSQYSFSVVIVNKEGKKTWFYVDFRLLNDITIHEPTILPRIPDTLNDLGNATVFSVLDLKTGCLLTSNHDSKLKKFTAFATPNGALYHCTVIP